MAYSPRPASEVIAEKLYLRDGYANQKKIAISDGNAPGRVDNQIKAALDKIDALKAEIAALELRKSNWRDIVDMCDRRIDEINAEVAALSVTKSEKELLMDAVRELMQSNG